MSNPLLAAWRVAFKCVALGLLTLVIVPTQAIVLLFSRGPASMRVPPLFHRGTAVVLGLDIEVSGTPVPAQKAVFISNHLSYLDISAIGGVVRACFVAKDDVRDWPVMGTLASLQQTVYISRRARAAHAASAALSAALGAGHRLVLFAEGTTSDGADVLPFKSSIFALLAEPALKQVPLQPISIELLEVDGRSVGAGGNRDLYAYHGDMHLGPHLLAFMRASGARLRIHFHSPLISLPGESRKELATRVRQAVVQGIRA